MNLLATAEKFFQKILGNELDLDLKSYLIKGSFHSILIQVFSMGLNFLSGIILARMMGAEGYGVFTLVFTLLSVICTVAVFGTDDLLVRDVSSLRSRENISGIKAIFKWSVLRVAVFSVLVSFILFLFINFSGIVPLQKQIVFNIALIGIPVFSLTMILQAGQRGMHHVIQGQLPEKIVRPLIFLLVIISFYYLAQEGLSAASAIIINIAAIAFAFFLLAFQTGKIFRANSPGENSIPSLWKGKEATSSFYFFIATIMAVINVRADILMLGWMRPDAEVGIYNVAARFSDFTAFSLLILTPVIAPSISNLFARKETAKLQHLVSKTARANFVFAFFITTVLIMLGTLPLKLFGNEFSSGYLCMILLCGGQLITTFAGPAGNILLMTGFEKLAFYSGLAGTIINIGLNFLLIPKYGINGAALATACSLLVWNGLQAYFVFEKLKINPTVIKL